MDITCLGEALIDFVALEVGVTVGDATGFLKAPGGAPANVAVGVARLGRRSAFLGKVGNDPFGRFLEHTLASNGVATAGMRFDPDTRTGLAFVSLQANGERDFVFFRNPSADMGYAPHELDRALVGTSRIFHFGSITLIEEPSRRTTLAAVEVARTSGSIISYDPNLRPPLWPSLDAARSAIRETLPLADVVKVSEEELEFLTGEAKVPSGVGRMFDLCPHLALLAVTGGASGCLAATPQGIRIAERPPSVEAVDTTGAGDGFVAGALVQLLDMGAKRDNLPDTLTETRLRALCRYANAVGALTCTRKGAIPALPTAADVAAVLERTECAG